MNDGENEIKLDAKLDTYKGTVVINILDIIRDLNEDQKKELLQDGGWWSLVEEEMATAICYEFSRKHYNNTYTKLRSIILNSDSMPSVIREWAKAMTEELESSEEAEHYWRDAYYELYHFVTKYDYPPDMPRLPERKYGREYSKKLMAEVEEKIREWGLLFPEPGKEE